MVDDFVLEGEKLYNDGNIRIHESKYADEHDIVIRKNYIFLDRGIMSEWATASTEKLRAQYFNLRKVDYETENPFVPIEEFGWALAKAQIKKLEDRLYSF